MSRSLALGSIVWCLGALACLGAVGCGASEPRESDIFHDPALRAGTIEPAGPAERALLARLSNEPEPGSVEIEGRTFVLAPTYDAASGHRCRAVSSEAGRRLVCELSDGWRFVPNIGRTQ